MNPSIEVFFCLSILAHTACGQDISDCRDESCLETLHFDSVRLNGKIPLMLKDTERIRLLGQPDSVITVDDWECGNYLNEETTFRMLYYGKTQFMSSRGMSLLYVLNLEDNRLTFDFGGTKLKKGMTKSDLASIFPNAMACLNAGLQGYNRDGRMKVKMLQTPEFGDSSGWLFTFSGHTIKEITLWWFIC